MAARKKTPKRARKARKTTRARKAKSKAALLAASLEPEGSGGGGEFGIETTGRMIATFLDSSTAGVRAALATMRSKGGVKQVSHARDFRASAIAMEDAESADAIVLDKLGCAILSGPPDQGISVAAAAEAGEGNMVIEPEYVNFAFQEGLDEDVGDEPEPVPGMPYEGGGGGVPTPAYLRGYRDAIDQLLRAMGGGEAAAAAADFQAAATFSDTSSSTWGLKATRVLTSTGSGRGIRVAVLDTGMDLNHPDFAGRSITHASFIRGESVQDGNGHGTHCIGTSCGPQQPGRGPRYGIAFGARIFAGKVLSNAGRGGDGSILAGINWALQNRCQVISMSLGRRVQMGERPQLNYETAGRRALRAGTLIVAAAGNDSSRPFVTVPVSSPANAASIAAVAALDRFLQVARFSNRGINPGGGEINLAGPGVDVHSSWPMPIRLRSISGTSMATPHVAGVAALVAEESAAFRGVPLYRELRRRARRLPLARADVGNGLVQA